jgi:type II secretory pathway component PulF
MKSNQIIWLIVAAVALYSMAAYCKELIPALYPLYEAWFAGKPLPALSEYALNASAFVSRYGALLAGALIVLAGAIFWCNRAGASVDQAIVAPLNTVGYYAAKGVLLAIVALAILQAHGMLILFLAVDREVRKELGEPTPELESKVR